MSRLFFDWIAPLLTKIYQPAHLLASIAQIRWTYDGFERSDGLQSAGGFHPGSRIADLPLINGRSLYSAFGTHQNVAVISVKDPEKFDVATARIAARTASLVVLASPVAGRFGRSLNCVFYCRPDGFITHISPLGVPQSEVTSPMPSATLSLTQ